MRKVTSCFLAFALLAAMFPTVAFADVRKADVIVGETVEKRGLKVAQCPSIDAKYAALIDSSGNVYFNRSGNDATQIASITKVMTALVACENADSNTEIVVSEDAATIGGSSADLREGDRLDLDAALRALLVPSGNDAAVALAQTLGKTLIDQGKSSAQKPEEAFVEAMNAKAASLGCENTVYENPHGLDDGSFKGNLHSTALDQAKVAKAAMANEAIRAIVSAGSCTIKVKRDNQPVEIFLETTDELLDMYDYALGVKTGMTDAAGFSFMAAASKDDRELYAVVLDSTDPHQRFVDAKILFEWYYEHVKTLKLAQSDRWTKVTNSNKLPEDVPVIASVSHGDWLDKTVEATLEDPNAAIAVFDLEGNVSQSVVFDELRGTINVGDKVGTITYRQRNMVVAEMPLVAAERVEGPDPFTALAIMGQRFIGGFSGEPASAESSVYNVMPIIKNNKTSAA